MVVKDIRHLDFLALKKAGFRGAVFDKDNCLTIPHKDELVPELNEAWTECKSVFGPGNVVIVSNSAGTRLDGGGIQAESVSYHLGVPVLTHTSMKPSYSCINTIRQYFASLPSPVPDEQLIIVGDRIFTDVVLANRMRTWKGWRHFWNRTEINDARGPLAVWTNGVWQKEATTMRWGESKLLELVQRWSRPPMPDKSWDPSVFMRAPVAPPKPTEKGSFGTVLGMLGLRKS